eukprot:206011_1
MLSRLCKYNVNVIGRQLRSDSWNYSAQSAKQNLNILCFGASLTSGYYENGLAYEPYANTLEQLIMQRYSSIITKQISVTESGVDGEFLVVTMKDRLQKLLNEKQFDMVIMLGGSNDLGMSVKPEIIWNTLESIYKMIIDEYKCICTGVTIPESQYDNDWSLSAKSEINAKIFDYQQNKSNMFYCDLCKLMPYHAMTDKQRELFWDDGLHLTKAGYIKFGRFAFRSIQPWLDTYVQ